MKTLVYENYNKFISATETIRSMKSTIAKMEADMHTLSQSMRHIDQQTSTTNDTMAARRDKIDELSGVNRLLKGRQFLFDLPTRLRHDLEHERYADAVKYFLLTTDVLASYEHIPSFGAISLESKQIMAKLRARLWERVRSPGPDTTMGSLAEAMGLLIDLHEDYNELLALYVAHCRARLAATRSSDDVARAGLDVLSERVLQPMVAMGAGFVACFVDRTALTSTESAEGRKLLLDLLNEYLNAYFALAHARLATEANVSDVVDSVTCMSSALRSAVAKLPFRLDDKVSELVLAAIRGYVDRDLALVHADAMGALQTVAASAEPLKGCHDAVDSICSSVASFVENLRPLLDPKWEVERDTLALVRQIATKLAGLFVGLADRAMSFVDQPEGLAVAALLVMLEKRGVPMAKEGVAALAVLANAHPTSIDPQYRANELVGILHGAADALLQSFTHARASRLARLVTRSLEAGNWLSPELGSARKPRMVVSVLADEIKSLDAFVGGLFGSEGDTAPMMTAASRRQALPSYLRAGQASDEMARMFDEKVRIYDRVDFTNVSVTAFAVRVLLKAWIECLRTRVLNRHALHQMQVDVQALRMHLEPLLAADAMRSADLLIGQVEAAAEGRCVDPQPLSATVVQQILRDCAEPVAAETPAAVKQ